MTREKKRVMRALLLRLEQREARAHKKGLLWPLTQCEAQTRQKRQCRGKANKHYEGKPLCHVHHPEMLNQLQLQQRRDMREFYEPRSLQHRYS